jgi:hypothetical protein
MSYLFRQHDIVHNHPKHVPCIADVSMTWVYQTLLGSVPRIVSTLRVTIVPGTIL